MVKSSKIFDVILFTTILKKYIEYKWFHSMKILWIYNKTKKINKRYLRRDYRFYAGRMQNDDFFDHYHKVIKNKVYWVYDFDLYYGSASELLLFNNFFYKKNYKSLSILNWPHNIYSQNPRNKKQFKVAKYSIFKNYINNFFIFGRGAKYYESKVKIEFFIYMKSIIPLSPIAIPEDMIDFISTISLKKKTFKYFLKYGNKFLKANFLYNIDFNYNSYDNSIGLLLISPYYDENFIIKDEVSSKFINYFSDNFYNVFYLYDDSDSDNIYKNILDLKDINEDKLDDDDEVNMDDISNIFSKIKYEFNLINFEYWNKHYQIEYYKIIVILVFFIIN